MCWKPVLSPFFFSPHPTFSHTPIYSTPLHSTRMSLPTLGLDQDSGLPTYVQLHGPPSKTVPSPTAGLRATLETMLQEISRDMSNISTLLQEVSCLPSSSRVSRDLFSQMQLLDLYASNKEVCWKGLQDERRRLLQGQQQLKVELAKLTGRLGRGNEIEKAWKKGASTRERERVCIFIARYFEHNSSGTATGTRDPSLVRIGPCSPKTTRVC